MREIVVAARQELRTAGAQGMTMSAIARAVGMTAPGLYRYVSGVDGLLTLLISEGFTELADRAERARDAVPRDDPGGRFAAMALELRDWAREDIAQFGLLFGSPLPGYAAPEDGPTTDGARRAGGVLWQVVSDAQQDGLLGTALVTEVEPQALAYLQQKGDDEATPALPPASQAAVWASLSLLLGSVADEVFTHAIPTDDITGLALYRGRIKMALRLLGLPDQKQP
jgi:AcrR family transcriptional regulator